jgi:hypothetical protein
MLRIARTPARGSLCASVAVLVALGILLLAGSARAASPSESAPEASSPPAAEPAPAASAPGAEPAPEPSSPVAPVVETVEEALAPVETVVESAPEVPVLAPVVEAAPETSPPPEPIKEVKEAPADESDKEAKEPVAEAIKEAMQETATTGQDAAPANDPAAAVGPEVSSAPDGPLPTILPGESQTPSATGSADAAALARRMIAAQRAENFDRALGGLGSPLIGTAGDLDRPALLSASAVLVDDLSGGTTSSMGAPAGGRSGGSPGGSSPIGPPPGPPPNGTFGGAAGGGTGIALSGFPTFAGHLLRGAPVAMRRLRLSFQPWLTAFFVLIPERPG